MTNLTFTGTGPATSYSLSLELETRNRDRGRGAKAWSHWFMQMHSLVQQQQGLAWAICSGVPGKMWSFFVRGILLIPSHFSSQRILHFLTDTELLC